MKKAFGLIELIFAILVISIALLAIPPLFTQLSSSIEGVLRKEAIFYAYYQNGNILTYRWDENSLADENSSHTVALATQAGDSELSQVKPINPEYRIGAVTRKIDLNKEASSILQQEADDVIEDDIDDFNNKTYTIQKESGDFVLEMNITNTISYIGDHANYYQEVVNFFIEPEASIIFSTNIKLIKTVISNKGENILVLYSFACNNGEPVLKSKVFQ